MFKPHQHVAPAASLSCEFSALASASRWNGDKFPDTEITCEILISWTCFCQCASGTSIVEVILALATENCACGLIHILTLFEFVTPWGSLQLESKFELGSILCCFEEPLFECCCFLFCAVITHAASGMTSRILLWQHCGMSPTLFDCCHSSAMSFDTSGNQMSL